MAVVFSSLARSDQAIEAVVGSLHEGCDGRAACSHRGDAGNPGDRHSWPGNL